MSFVLSVHSRTHVLRLLVVVAHVDNAQEAVGGPHLLLHTIHQGVPRRVVSDVGAWRHPEAAAAVGRLGTVHHHPHVGGPHNRRVASRRRVIHPTNHHAVAPVVRRGAARRVAAAAASPGSAARSRRAATRRTRSWAGRLRAVSPPANAASLPEVFGARGPGRHVAAAVASAHRV
ncbi:hypothetical protein MRX96_038253 [Rhipicephalus microplus]